jgi:uncharacterized protein (TIGR01777 family)
MKKLIIAGGTGFLGGVLTEHFSPSFDEIVLLSRKPKPTKDKIRTVVWDAKSLGPWHTELDGATVLINMTGRSVDCRYTTKNKADILHSRVDATLVLGMAIAKIKNPPTTWLNSSTATIYRHSTDVLMDEEHGEIGCGFSVDVATAWEKAFFNSPTPNTRKVALRTSIVLGKNGGALLPIKRLTQLGLGGKQGNGKQKFSWIHEIDFAQSIAFILDHASLEGPINIVAPSPSTNSKLMKLMRNYLQIPFGLPASKGLLEIGARIIRTETELILKSRNVIPTRLLDAGYSFSYCTLETALKNLLK